jgi:hypothetical protein
MVELVTGSDLAARYHRYVSLVARNSLKGIGPGEPLMLSEWIKQGGIKAYHTPLKGSRIIASQYHHNLKAGQHIGVIRRVDGNIIKFIDRNGEKDSIIWRFKSGNNKTIHFTA